MCEVDEHDAKSEFPNYRLKPGPYVCLEVKDTGCGMDEQMLSRIFDPFFSTKFTGRGLGLAAVSGIVRGHHGAMSVASAPGKGSTFRVLLPGVAARAEKPVAAPCDCVARGVLVIDREEFVRHTAERALAAAGYKVFAAGSGGQAMQVFRDHACEVGLIVLDANLGDMTGPEAIKRLREVRREVPILVSSGYSEQDASRRFDGQHIDGFLQKPYTPTALEERVALLF
jgi:CheY-like chemotaxis protein